MRRISDNVYTEFYFPGCNPTYLATSDGVVLFDTPQQPIDALRWREQALSHGPIRYLINTEPHIDHIMGNAYFPEAEVIGQLGMPERYEQAVPMMTSDERLEMLKQSDPDSVWLYRHPDYPPNPPTRTFTDELTLHLGAHAIQCLHLPGHTAPQTAVYLPEEGVLITGDNIFHKVRSWIQEADPWQWLDSLKRIGEFDATVIVPGHGEPCDQRYLAVQAEIIETWIGAVEEFVRRGLTEEEALQQPVPQADPYPIGQRLHHLNARLDGLNVSNIYRHIVARQQPAGVG